MRKILGLVAIATSGIAFSQFSVKIEASSNFTPKEAYLYTLNGSKDILQSKGNRVGNNWSFSLSKPYSGMMKIYFPDTNTSVNFISENKDVQFKIETKDDKVTNVEYLDMTNKLMHDLQDNQQKKEYILPALYQIKEYYKNNSDFGKALDAEINSLSKSAPNSDQYPFISFYTTNYAKFVTKDPTKPITSDEVITFVSKSNDRLETSSLLRPTLLSYLNMASKDDLTGAIDKLLTAVNVETPRGQTVMSELIDIFNVYGMNDLKVKYLDQAKALKCTLNDRLTETLAVNANTEVGAKFPDNKFVNATNTKAKSLHEIKANKRVIMFWSSTCSHCEKELPELLAVYNEFKKQNIEIIGLSLDADKASYTNKVSNLPWINDSELKGWYSSYGEKYNVHATPTYYILDSSNKIIAKPDHAADVIKFFNVK